MVRIRFGQNVYGYEPFLLKKVIWAVGSSPLCSQYTSGWICPWARPKNFWIRLWVCVYRRFGPVPARKM